MVSTCRGRPRVNVIGGGRRAGQRRLRDKAWLTELALGLVGIAGKRLGVPFGSERLGYRRRGLIDAPEPENQQHQPEVGGLHHHYERMTA